MWTCGQPRSSTELVPRPGEPPGGYGWLLCRPYDRRGALAVRVRVGLEVRVRAGAVSKLPPRPGKAPGHYVESLYALARSMGRSRSARGLCLTFALDWRRGSNPPDLTSIEGMRQKINEEFVSKKSILRQIHAIRGQTLEQYR
jgi:hypothetical protein